MLNLPCKHSKKGLRKKMSKLAPLISTLVLLAVSSQPSREYKPKVYARNPQAKAKRRKAKMSKHSRQRNRK
jgi:hypothetical protein